MLELAYLWLIILLFFTGLFIYVVLRDAEIERKKELGSSIKSLERELDLDDTCKVKQPPAPKPQKIER